MNVEAKQGSKDALKVQPLFRDGQRPPQKALEIILGYMRKVSVPVYLGFISLEVGWSLARTEEMMLDLELAGAIFRLDEKQVEEAGHKPGSVMYSLVGQPLVPIWTRR